jgi:hypothetical protein
MLSVELPWEVTLLLDSTGEVMIVGFEPVRSTASLG